MFTALRKLRVEQAMLLPNEHRDISDPFVDILPPSLETLDVLGPLKPHQVTELFLRFWELRSDRLPNLKRITCQYQSLEHCCLGLERLCNMAGISLVNTHGPQG